MKKHTLYILVLLIIFSGCKKTSSVSNTAVADNSLTHGYALFYGDHYNYIDITENVVGLSLFSKFLSTDSAGYYVGNGTRLVVTDIFTSPSDTLLPQGGYTANDNHSPMTFLKSKSYEGNRVGAYIVIVGATGYTTETLTDGAFELQYKRDTVIITFDFKRENGTSYQPVYKGLLPMYDARPNKK